MASFWSDNNEEVKNLVFLKDTVLLNECPIFQVHLKIELTKFANLCPKKALKMHWTGSELVIIILKIYAWNSGNIHKLAKHRSSWTAFLQSSHLSSKMGHFAHWSNGAAWRTLLCAICGTKYWLWQFQPKEYTIENDVWAQEKGTILDGQQWRCNQQWCWWPSTNTKLGALEFAKYNNPLKNIGISYKWKKWCKESWILTILWLFDILNKSLAHTRFPLY